jgi:hypothetical protein
MKNVKQLVVGLGEVGSALQSIFECDGHDPFKNIHGEGQYDIVHVAIPYKDDKQFTDAVLLFREMFNPILMINHSSVPVGTSRRLNMVHSPIRGVHPHLEEGIRTMVKYFGAVDKRDAMAAAFLFEIEGIETRVADKPEDTEAAKLWCTTGYGLNIILEKQIHQYCVDNDLDFDLVYTDFISTYNRGYRELGMPQYTKYNLKHMDGGIGGHCVRENCKLLGGEIADYILKQNEKYTN